MIESSKASESRCEASKQIIVTIVAALIFAISSAAFGSDFHASVCSLLLGEAQKGQKIVFQQRFPGLDDPITLFLIFDRVDGNTLYGEGGFAVPLQSIIPGSLRIEPAPPKPNAPPPSTTNFTGIPMVRDGRVFGFVDSVAGFNMQSAESDLAQGETQETTNAIKISRKGIDDEKLYNRTNRGYETLVKFYPIEMIDSVKLRGMVVVDMATGGGKIVEQWRNNGVTAFGLDAALSNRQKALVYNHPVNFNSDLPMIDLSAPGREGFYIQADAAHTGIASDQVDIIYSTYAMFEYDLYDESSRQILVDILYEWHRILREGGRIRISPFVSSGRPIIEALVSMIPGLRIQAFKSVNPEDRDSKYYVEIIKKAEL